MAGDVTIGALCTAVVDCEHKTAPDDVFGSYWSIGTPAMRGHRIDYSAAKRISRSTYDEWTRRAVPQAGDLILSREAPVGLVVRVPAGRQVSLGQRTMLLRPDPETVDARYLYFLLQGAEMQQRLQERAEGSTVPHLNLAEVRELRVPPLPDLLEQRAIAGALGALDDKLECNRHRATTAEALLDVLASAFGALDPGPLGDLVEVDRVACTPGSQREVLVDHFSLPAFDAARLPDRTPGSTIKSNKLRVIDESVLVSRLNPSTNRTWFAVPDPLTMAAASTEFLVLRPVAGVGLGALWLAVRDEYFRAELARRATGTSGSHQRLRPDDALAIDVPDVRRLPSEVAAEAEGLVRLAHHSRTESRTLAELRDALLPELLSGRSRVAVADELVEAAT